MAVAMLSARVVAQHVSPARHVNTASHVWPVQGGTTAFYENRGQIADGAGRVAREVAYEADFGNARVYVTRQGWYTAYYSVADRAVEAVSEATGRVGDLSDARDQSNARDLSNARDKRLGGERDAARVYRMGTLFEGSNPDVEIAAEALVREYRNYYLGHCPEGITHVPGYRVLRFRNLYDHIDLLLYAAREGLKYEFEVRPGGRVEEIRLRHEGAAEIERQPDGGMRLPWPGGYTHEQRPYAYERAPRAGSTGPRAVDASYRVEGNTVGFSVGAHDPASVLVIDPWSTYYGGNESDIGYRIACDRRGSVLVAGQTRSLDFPVLNAWQDSLGWNAPGAYADAFILKLDSAGAPLWCTYFGGRGHEHWFGLAVDTTCNVILCGATKGGDLPIDSSAWQSTLGGIQDGFVAKFSPAGTRLWATYLGGYEPDNILSVGTDDAGCVYGVGGTESPNFPVQRAWQSQYGGGDRDLICFKFTPAGRLVFASYYGGAGEEEEGGIAVASDGQFVLSGWNRDGNFPTKNAWQSAYGGVRDAVLARFDSSGVPLWSTYCGGSGVDEGRVVCWDAAGNILLAGRTTSTDFPVLRASQGVIGGEDDVFIAKFDGTGTPIWSTYFGGSKWDVLTFGLTSDSDGNVLIAGATQSRDLPVLHAAYPAMKDPASASLPQDAFVAKFDSTAGLQWATYFGGSARDFAGAAACDSLGKLYICGSTQSTDFPTRDAVQDSLVIGNSVQLSQDAFIARFDADGTIPVTLALFTAVRVAEGVELAWRTESEVNAHGFEIERRDLPDGSWTCRGFVPATGGATAAHAYRWLDRMPEGDDTGSWYRLRMIDYDGSYEYSPVVAVGPSEGSVASGLEIVLPAGSSDWLTVRLSLCEATPVRVTAHDIVGREVAVLCEGAEYPRGTHTLAVPVARWRSGAYLFTLHTSAGHVTEKALILH
jgi:hypothetical protein